MISLDLIVYSLPISTLVQGFLVDGIFVVWVRERLQVGMSSTKHDLSHVVQTVPSQSGRKVSITRTLANEICPDNVEAPKLVDHRYGERPFVFSEIDEAVPRNHRSPFGDPVNGVELETIGGTTRQEDSGSFDWPLVRIIVTEIA